jgi:multiple antibiotic resistance protein
MEHWSEYSRFFIALLVILDPFLAIPLFIELTREHDDAGRRRVARLATLTVLVALVLTALTGGTLLAWLGTSIGSFRVGGGIVLFLMAHGMLKTRVGQMQGAGIDPRLPPHHASEAVVPLAIPLLAGPGAMSTVILTMQRSSAPRHVALVLLIIVAVALVQWLVLSLARPIGARLGEIGLNIMNRVFGLLLAAIAVEVVAGGLKQLFPVLAG